MPASPQTGTTGEADGVGGRSAAAPEFLEQGPERGPLSLPLAAAGAISGAGSGNMPPGLTRIAAGPTGSAFRLGRAGPDRRKALFRTRRGGGPGFASRPGAVVCQIGMQPLFYAASVTCTGKL
jgi:hypothetical protein